MATAPDANGIPRYDETDGGANGTFSGLLNLMLGWVSAALTTMKNANARSIRLRRDSDQVGNPTNNVETAFSFSSDLSASGDWVAASPDRVKFTKAGTYLWTFSARLSSAGVYITPYLNNQVIGVEMGGQSYPRASGVITVAVNDVFQIRGRPLPGGAWTSLAGFAALDFVRVPG